MENELTIDGVKQRGRILHSRILEILAFGLEPLWVRQLTQSAKASECAAEKEFRTLQVHHRQPRREREGLASGPASRYGLAVSYLLVQHAAVPGVGQPLRIGCDPSSDATHWTQK
jgi:hypothetical protein